MTAILGYNKPKQINSAICKSYRTNDLDTNYGCDTRCPYFSECLKFFRNLEARIMIITDKIEKGEV